MINQLKNWTGAVEINGTLYNSIDELQDFDFKTLSESSSIKLLHTSTNAPDEQASTTGERVTNTNTEYKIVVKSYMTKKATPDFDFMAQWNDDNPMPLRIMYGEKVRETKGMVYMNLHGDIVDEINLTCMKCGKPIVNPVSKFFGMGPTCGGHNYVNPFETEEELKEAVDKYRLQMREITWSGWIVKSAILEEELVVIPVDNRVV